MSSREHVLRLQEELNKYQLLSPVQSSVQPSVRPSVRPSTSINPTLSNPTTIIRSDPRMTLHEAPHHQDNKENVLREGANGGHLRGVGEGGNDRQTHNVDGKARETGADDTDTAAVAKLRRELQEITHQLQR